MKSFINFLTEAKQSQAVKQATQMGLTSDGHGGWYDQNGQFVAKTEGGRLVFFDGRKVKEEKPKAKKKPKAKEQQDAAAAQAADPAAAQAQGQEQQAAQDPAAQDPAQAAAQEPQVQTAPADVPKTKGTLTIAFGRFNPPTSGHQKLLDTVASSSDDNDYMIVPSRSEDPKKNPFDADSKVKYMRQLYPDHAEKIVNDPGNRTIFDVMRKAHNDGYANVRIVGGGDRVKEYEKLANKYNGSTYQFDGIEVVNAGDRDPDSDGVEGMSASKMREAAKKNDFRAFKKGLPKGTDNEFAVSMFTDLQQRMGIEVSEGWQYAPRLNFRALRENYILEKTFNIGDTVIHDFTGLEAEIVRKGTNHLICVTEDDIMFKAWTQDVSYPGHIDIDAPIRPNSLNDFLRKFGS